MINVLKPCVQGLLRTREVLERNKPMPSALAACQNHKATMRSQLLNVYCCSHVLHAGPSAHS
jgi:hypothetical protein